MDESLLHESPRELATLVDRLSNRLGSQAVLRPWLLAGAQPEFACQYQPLASLSLRQKAEATPEPRVPRATSTVAASARRSTGKMPVARACVGR